MESILLFSWCAAPYRKVGTLRLSPCQLPEIGPERLPDVEKHTPRDGNICGQQLPIWDEFQNVLQDLLSVTQPSPSPILCLGKHKMSVVAVM